MFFTALGTAVEHGRARACYVPDRDVIPMPDLGLSQDATAHHATFAQRGDALGRVREPARATPSGRFGSEAYAAEKLVAERGATFLCADLRLAAEPRPDHTQHVASRFRVLRGDKRAIFTAAAEAQQVAANWMHRRQARAGKPAKAARDYLVA